MVSVGGGDGRMRGGRVRCRVALGVLFTALAGGLASAEAQESSRRTDPAEQLYSQGEYSEAFALQRSRAADAERADMDTAGRPSEKTATALGKLAWYGLFARAFDEALRASTRGIAIAPEA